MTRGRIGAGTWIAIGAALVFVALWHDVLLGRVSLVGIDLLYQAPPWVWSPEAHNGRNSLVWDTVQEIYPWYVSVRDAVLNGRLPLWDPFALSGRPLLANNQSAVFSPFTLAFLPFPPAVGMSLAMLAKLWVAGFGMAAFLRAIGLRPVAAGVAGVIYGTSSVVVVWLGWPQSAVMALMPWSFAAAEWYLRTRSRRSLACLAIAWALHLVAGHAELSFQFGVAFGVYVVGRWISAGRDLRALRDLTLACVLGTVLAGAQLVPFVSYLAQTTAFSDRSSNRISLAHISPRELTSWVIPNALGNPGIDRRWDGAQPNYNEATGFVGVGALMLAAIGLAWLWRHHRSVAVGLGALMILSAGAVYGPLTPMIGRLPVLEWAPTRRLLAVTCFALAALAGAGIHALHEPRDLGRARRLGAGLLAAGAIAVVGLVVMGSVLVRQWAGVTVVVRPVGGLLGFWVIVAGLSAVAAIAFGIAGLTLGRSRGAIAGFVLLALIESALFAGPYNPRVPLREIPPQSPAIDWLVRHAGSARIAGLNGAIVPETARLYGLRDVRGVDPMMSGRQIEYWARADTSLVRDSRMIVFARPDVRWLAAAGVAYVLSDRGNTPDGTRTVFTAPNIAIGAVPHPQPFAAVAARSLSVANLQEAVARYEPGGAAVVERGPPLSESPSPDAFASVVRRRPEEIELSVTTDVAATVVVLQSYSPDWNAWVDGARTEVRPTNILFQGITVPAGTHRVVLKYQPLSVPFGLLASGIAGLLLIAAWWTDPERTRRRMRPLP